MIENQGGFLPQGIQQSLIQIQQGLALLGGEAQKGPLLHGKHRVGHLTQELLSLGRDPHQLVFPVVGHVLQLEKAPLFQLLEGGVDGLLAEKKIRAQLALADAAPSSRSV